jgi:hypothetical protein
MISEPASLWLQWRGKITQPHRLARSGINGYYEYVTLSQPKMLGSFMLAPGGGDARRPLAPAFRRHRKGDSFHEDNPERTHYGGRWFIKGRPPVVFNNENKNDDTQSTVWRGNPL